MVSAPTELGFRRSNAFAKIVDLSLAGRRLVDVAYFLAAENNDILPEYRVELGLFRWLMGTTSRNQRHLNKIIREAQQAAIVLNEVDVDDPSKDRWGSIPLMGVAFIQHGEFSFELADRLQRAIKNPTASHFLSLRYVFNSIHSKILFDRLQPYIDERVTPWFDVPALRGWLQCEKKTYDLFKHFRHKVLEVAIAEIREVTGMHVEILTQNVPGSKRIGQVRFRVDDSRQPKNEHKIEFIILRALYETLRSEFALSQTEFNEIITNREQYTDERIQQAIDYTRHNVTQGKVKLRAGGYFMKSLREGYLLGTLDRKIHEKAHDALAAKDAASAEATNREALMHAAESERAQKLADLGWEAYEQLDADKQADAVADFCRAPSSKPLARSLQISLDVLHEHLTDPRVRSSFGVFVAARVRQAAKVAQQAGASPATA